jgi:hypothetical protein
VGPGRIRPYLEENGFEDPAKPQISNRQLAVDSGTLLRGSSTDDDHDFWLQVLTQASQFRLQP